jgi:hypothetical protein
VSNTDLLADGCFTVADAAKFSTVCRSNLYKAMDAGEVPYIRRGNRRMIPKVGLIRWMVDGLIAPQERSSRECGPAVAGV